MGSCFRRVITIFTGRQGSNKSSSSRTIYYQFPNTPQLNCTITQNILAQGPRKVCFYLPSLGLSLWNWLNEQFIILIKRKVPSLLSAAGDRRRVVTGSGAVQTFLIDPFNSVSSRIRSNTSPGLIVVISYRFKKRGKRGGEQRRQE